MTPRRTALIAAIHEGLERGKTFTEIAAELDVSLSYISRLASQSGIVAPRIPRDTRRRSRDEWRAIFEEASGGKTATELAAELDVSTTAVRRMANQLGASLRNVSIHRNIDWPAAIEIAVEHDETVAQLARRVGVSYKSACWAVDYYGAKLRKGRKRRRSAEDTISLRSALLRGARAASGLKQADAYQAANIAENTLLDAEQGRRVSDRTWDALVSVYRKEGIDIDLEQGRLSVNSKTMKKPAASGETTGHAGDRNY